jgi:glycosyltransferase involved in cell wall biosynthesis
MPEVSVVIPTHNRRELLSLTLRSVLWQRDVDVEVIVVDDGSTDDTVAMVGSVNDPRVRVIHHERPQGVSAARNDGIAEATGRWVAFLDDDDLWAPDKLALQLRALHDSGRQWAYAGRVQITIDNRVFAGQPPPDPRTVMQHLTTMNLIGGPSTVIAQKAALPLPAFDRRLHHSPDWDLWIRLARTGPPACAARPLVGYRIHPGSASLDMEGMLAELDEIERRYGGTIERAQYNRYLASLALKTGWYRRALHYYHRAMTAGDGRYTWRDFLPDAWQVLSRALGTRATAVGLRVPSVLRSEEPFRPWRDEARAWIGDLVSDRPRGWAKELD